MARRTPRWSNTRRGVRRPGERSPRRPASARWDTVLLYAVTIVVVVVGLVVAHAYDVPLCSHATGRARTVTCIARPGHF